KDRATGLQLHGRALRPLYTHAPSGPHPYHPIHRPYRAEAQHVEQVIAVTGLIVFRYDVSWQWQLIWFCALSLAAVLLAAKYLRTHPLDSERPLLNERAVQLTGQSFNLVDPIVNGRGSIKTGDTI